MKTKMGRIELDGTTEVKLKKHQDLQVYCQL